MILPETWIAKDILKRIWGIDADLSLLSLSDNGCSWFCEKYVLKASPQAWWKADHTYRAWENGKHAVKFIPLPNDGHFLSDGQWVWTLQEWVNGRQYNGTWEDAELVARAMREFSESLSMQSYPWFLNERTLYANLNSWERAKVNDWLIANKEDPEWENVRQTLGNLIKWYMEGAGLPKWPAHIVHYDLHPGNCLIADDVTFIDPALCYGDPFQALAFAASRFWPVNPPVFLSRALGEHLCRYDVEDWRRYVRRETIMRVNWLLRVNYVMGGNAWRQDLRKHLDYLCH